MSKIENVESNPGAQVAPAPERYLEVAKRMRLLHQGPGAGVVFWKPAGLRLYERLRGFIREAHERWGYEEVRSPSLAPMELFERSGHAAKYRDAMFLASRASVAEPAAGEARYALRPMSCPNHMELFACESRSYRELPVRFFEFGEVFRNEPAGSLQALFRMRQFCQDDSHIFCSQEQVEEQVARYLSLAEEIYQKLGFKSVSLAIALRPQSRFGDEALWDKAEQALRDACARAGREALEKPGEGAFYGPKIEIVAKDKLGRGWQLGVIQLDYVLPERFGLEFDARSGARERPVMLHHAVLGSLERMIGILLEEHGEQLPLFLHPHEAVVVPVSQVQMEHARRVREAARGKHFGALLDESDAPLSEKIKRWRSRGVPHIYVVGKKEQELFEIEGRLCAQASGHAGHGLVEFLAETQRA